MGVKSFWTKPARATRGPNESESLIDLDALESKSVWFRFNNTAYEIRPITTGAFVKVLEKFIQIDALLKKDSLSGAELIDYYSELFQMVCPEFTKELVGQMNQQQAAALFMTIYRTVTGENSEKKNLLSGEPPNQSA